MSGPTIAAGVRTRTALAFAAVAAAAVLAGWVWATHVADSTEAARLEAEASALRAWPRVALEVETGRLARAGALVARRIDARGMSDTSGRELPELAPARASELGLDMLEILDGDGRVVSSSHWPERAGLPGQNWLDARRGAFARAETASGERPAWIVSRPVGDSRPGWTLVAGTFLDTDLFGGVLRGMPRTVVEIGEGPDPVRDWPDGALEPGAASQALGAADARIASGSWWAVLTNEAGTLVAAAVALPSADRGGPERWLLVARRVPAAGSSFALVGAALAVAVLVAAACGWWIGGSAARPFEDAVRAMGAVSRGEADFGFTGMRPSEVERVVSSYSRTRQALEDQRRRLRAAERAAAWREAARRVAHDVKNPLAPIRLSMENLLRARRNAPDRFDEVLDESVRAVLDEVERLRRVVEAFGEFARLPEPRLEVGDLDELVDSLLALHGGEPGVRWERRRGSDVSGVPMDRDLLARAVRNVLVNAVQSLPAEGGRIAVETRREEDLAAVVIEDEGPGFRGESETRADEPYFTTREDGTGLGLAITARIAAEHGGYLRWENRREGGARVILAIPLRPAEREDEADEGDES